MSTTAFERELPDRLATIVERWHRMIQGGWSLAEAEKLYERVTDLAIMSSEHGLLQVSESALSLEVYLSSLVDAETTPSAKQLSGATHLIQALEAVVGKYSGEAAPPPTPVPPAPAAAPVSLPPSPETKVVSRPGVYFLGTDLRLKQALMSLCNQEEVRVVGFADAGEMLANIKTAPPSGMILEMLGPSAEAGNLTKLIEAIKAQLKDCPPFIVIGHSKDISLRLQAMRAGASAFFVAPSDPQEIAQKMRQLVCKSYSEAARVLVVDDDPWQAQFAAKVLGKAGMEVQLVTQPLAVLEALEGFKPDLILMDLYMPDASGTELTTIIREHNEFAGVPIVFLSGEQDTEKQMSALSFGGDDFLAKPVRPNHLIEVVKHRIERTQSLEKRIGTAATHDSLTKLFNRQHFLTVVGKAMTARNELPPASAVLFLELDAPQRLQEQVGIGGLDSLLAQLAPNICAVAKPTDITARFGDYSFVLWLRREHKKEVSLTADQLLERLTAQVYTIAGAALKVTLSAGIAMIDYDVPDISVLLFRAQKVCAQAQAEGGGRVKEYVAAAPTQAGDGKWRFLLQRALKQSRVGVLYQQLVSLRGGQGDLCQQYLRLENDEGVHLSTAKLLTLAAQEGLGAELDDFVIGRALDSLQQEAVRHRQVNLLINLSSAALTQDNWVTTLKEGLQQRRLGLGRCIPAFSLQEVARRLQSSTFVFRRLQELGCRISLSGFGEDPLSFNLLETLPVHYVQLAETLIKLPQDKLNALITRVHARNRQVIVVDIENARQVAQFWTAGADYLQGDFIQAPQESLGLASAEHAVL